MDTRNKIFAVVGTVAILATAGITGLALFTQKDTTTGGTTNTSQTTGTTGSSSSGASRANSNTTSPSTPSMSTMMTSGYKDGTYSSSTVSYYVPGGGQNSVKATVVISSGKISSVTTNDNYSERQSGYYVSSFESSVSSDAVGQSIGSYSPSQIGGASLTTYAFAQAISDIASQAKG